MTHPPVRRFKDFRWDDTSLLAYRQEAGVPFKDVTRQILFEAPDLLGELRYFEVAAQGFSSLERHDHRHAVVILRGHGRCLVGDSVYDVGPLDLVDIPPMTWHQFKASQGEPLGFLCLVNVERDKAQLPSETDLAEMRGNPVIDGFLG
ncbi:Cupin 2 conserved barrel domain protein [Rhodospirillaceae bacterium LM-1]|nr:Cupin 2 conserved barrel domain protein [Rhodospirillaceae bacterium LM-1]